MSFTIFAEPDDPGQMFVVWSTGNSTDNSTVLYRMVGAAKYMPANGYSRKFTDLGAERRTQYIHRVKLAGLTPGQKYGVLNLIADYCLFVCVIIFMHGTIESLHNEV